MARKNSETGPARRGRPRAYDTQAALKQATETFWRTGYSGTSLDSIAAATGMNPPSLYAAFGNKHALYLEALARYWEISLAATREALAEDRPLGESLMLAYEAALAVLASATMHSIAIRSRAGARRAELREIARKAVSVICGCQVETGR